MISASNDRGYYPQIRANTHIERRVMQARRVQVKNWLGIVSPVWRLHQDAEAGRASAGAVRHRNLS